jgi:pimeloyl-ACP methyl ester carboxylesterase
MAGARDIIKEEHTRLIASRIQGARLVIFPKGTHDEPRENPKRFNETVLSFLGSLSSQ